MRTALLILALTALACSRIALALFNDPEGPNLVVVVGLAAILYLISLAFSLSRFFPALSGLKRTAAAIVFQIVIAAGVYLGLR